MVWLNKCDIIYGQLLIDKREWLNDMGAQNTKERAPSVGTHSNRATRSRPRPTKDGRQTATTISNIFTEHNGEQNY